MKLTEKENEILFQLKKEITENVMMNSDAVLFYIVKQKSEIEELKKRLNIIERKLYNLEFPLE